MEPLPGVRRRRGRSLAALCRGGGRGRLAGAGARPGPGQRDRPGALARRTPTRWSRGPGCRTAKVKVADPTGTLADDQARLEAVRDALGPGGRIRVDANGAWDVDTAVASLKVLDRAAGGLEYVEQPCATVEDLAAVRRRTSVPSPPTSRSAGRPTPTGCATSRRPTSRCSRCSRSAGCGPACGSPRTSGCRSSSRRPWRRRSAWPRVSRWRRRCPSSSTPAGLATVGHAGRRRRRRTGWSPVDGVRAGAPSRGLRGAPGAAARPRPEREAHWRARLAEVRAVGQDRSLVTVSTELARAVVSALVEAGRPRGRASLPARGTPRWRSRRTTPRPPASSGCTPASTSARPASSPSGSPRSAARRR